MRPIRLPECWYAQARIQASDAQNRRGSSGTGAVGRLWNHTMFYDNYICVGLQKYRYAIARPTEFRCRKEWFHPGNDGSAGQHRCHGGTAATRLPAEQLLLPCKPGLLLREILKRNTRFFGINFFLFHNIPMLYLFRCLPSSYADMCSFSFDNGTGYRSCFGLYYFCYNS